MAPISMKFVISATKVEDLPATEREVAIVGRSNVGKSSLINAIANTQGAGAREPDARSDAAAQPVRGGQRHARSWTCPATASRRCRDASGAPGAR